VRTEERLLIEMLGSSPATALGSVAESSPIDWAVLFQLAMDHGVLPLICRHLLGCRPSCLPSEIADAAADYLKSLEARNGDCLARLFAVLDILDEAGVSAIPFKGPSLAIRAYDALGAREFGDLDFLIRVEQVERTIDCLSAHGFNSELRGELSPRAWRAFCGYNGQEVMHGPDVVLEPHWRFAPSTLGLEMDYTALWARVRSAPCLGRDIPCLELEDEVIQLCIHGGKEKWVKLKWVADLDAFIRAHARQIDWAMIVARSEQDGFSRMVRLGLYLCQKLTGLAFEKPMCDWVASDSVVESMARKVIADLFKASGDDSVFRLSRFHFQMRERSVDRWRYVWRTVSQPRVTHFRALKLPEALFSLYVPFKIAHDYLALPLWRVMFRRSPEVGVTH